MVISYFLLNKEIYEYAYDIRKIFLVIYEIRKFVKYMRNANTRHYPLSCGLLMGEGCIFLSL